MHGFLVPVRDKKTHIPLPGLEIGDWGDKIGLQGVDNGWIKFNQYRVPKSSLLNRFGDIRTDGVYFSMVSSKSKRFQFQIGSLSGGRIAIAQVSADIALAALTSTLRFFAVRKQFKNPITKQETLLLDYRINQYRLLSYFCKHFLFSVAISKITKFWDENLPMNLNPKNKNSSFIHMISSAAKAVLSWESNLAANEWRQALAGIGYSYYSGLKDTIGISDLNRTWEGDNYVLFQQTGRLLLKNLSNLFLGKPVMKTWEFLTPESPEPEHFTGSVDQLKDLLKLLSIRANTLIHETGARLQMAKDKIDEWDKSLSFYVYPMAHAYFHRFVTATYLEFIEQFNEDKHTKQVFENMGIIYAQSAILENAEFYRDYLSKEHIIEIKEDIMNNFKDLRKEVVAMTYLLQFRDKMLGAIGANDMNSYTRFLNAVQSAEGWYGKPSEWKYLYE